MKLTKHLATLFIILLTASLTFADLPDWQSNSAFRPWRINANYPRQFKVGGNRTQALTCLGTSLEFEPGHWPRLTRRTIGFQGIHASREQRLIFSLGHIALGDQPPRRFKLEHIDFSGSKVTFSGPDGKNLRFWMSRTTPALVLETGSDSLTFFAGKDSPQPKYLAAEIAGNVTITSAENISELNRKLTSASWLLIWFGKTHESSRFGIYTPLPYPADCPVLLLFENAPTSFSLENGLKIDFAEQVSRIALLPLFGDNYPLADFDEKLLDQSYRTQGGAYSHYEYSAGPLRKYSIPEKSFNTDLWSKAFPPDVTEQCRWWADHLHQVPVFATETYSYDSGTDTVTVSESFEYIKIAAGGTPFAPLPPTLALAAKQGFPVEFSAPVKYTKHLTAHGPFAGIENSSRYSWKIKGLNRYVHLKRPKPNLTNAPEALLSELETEVRKILDAGPYLAPWYPVLMNFGAGYKNYYRRGYEGHFLWQNPAETIYYLAECYPLLKNETKKRLLEYLINLREQFGPEKRTLLKFEDGTPREHYTRPPKPIINRLNQRWAERNFYYLHKIVPDKNLYYLARYYSLPGIKAPSKQQTADILDILKPYLKSQDWGTMGFFRRPRPWQDRQGSGGAIDINDYFSSLIGAIRLADMSIDSDSAATLRAFFAKTAALRFAIGKYPAYLYESGLLNSPAEKDWMMQLLAGSWIGYMYTLNWQGPQDQVATWWLCDQFGVYTHEGRLSHYKECPGLLTFFEPTPELGRFFADYLKPESRGLMRRVSEAMPAWYTTYCPAVHSFETNIQPPEDAYQLFMLNAWVLGEGPDRLSWLRDVPWLEKGDLFYIHKLAETIKAYGK